MDLVDRVVYIKYDIGLLKQKKKHTNKSLDP